MVKLLFIIATMVTFALYGINQQKKSEETQSAENKTEQDIETTKPINEITDFKAIHSFMGNHCYQCHGEKKQKGKLRLDNLEFNEKTILVWQDVVDQLSTGEMPPEDEKMPSEEERQKMISSIQKNIDNFNVKPNASVLRRLTQKEYVNTVRDLFGMRTEVFMGASEFPPDERKHNFSNNGDALVTSSYLMDKYLDAANSVVEQVLPPETDKPKVQKWTFTPPFDTSTRDYVSWFYGKTNYQDILQNDISLRAIYLHINKFAQGVPHRGYYNIKLTVEGKNRKKNPSPLGNKAEALSIKVAAGAKTDGDLVKNIKSDKFIGEYSLPDDKVHTVNIRTWLEKGYTLKFTFPQGHDTVKKSQRIAFNEKADYLKGANPKKYQNPKAFSWTKTKNRVTKRGADRIISSWAVFMEEYSKHFPTLRKYKVEIEGPFYDQWPHRPKSQLLGNKSYDESNPQEVVANLASRAFRRPVEKWEIQPILEFVSQTLKQTGSKREALANGIRVILCSPQFFYHYENEGKLSDYSLASRLSYFLWSTMPDKTLMDLAKSGKLGNKEILKAELNRMLKDLKAKHLTYNLADQWLELWKLGSMAPDLDKEQQYYRRHMKTHSKYETTELLDYILKENKPVMDILTADYTFMNRGLAEFYGIKDFHKYPTDKFVKTQVRDRRRSGIFGHMGLMTATANGVDTSPIIRGLWVYEAIMGKPAPTPPDSVPAIEPDLRNAKTIRDKLVKHREDKDCSVCHKKFDHFGFALENFDQLGRWRTDYREGKKVRVPISSYGTMVTGEKFKNITEMRQLLAKNEDMFCNTVASKLLNMAMGREVNSFDREKIQDILKEAKTNGNGLKDLLTAVVTSELFESK
ncbi:MAG: DUF1592 domain-containing protein [Lentisphaerales bacterium]|nr:DUF1592 domain-containing protein [Lentisphaerales bacterium]